MKELYADIQLIDLPLPYDGVALTLDDLVYKEYYAWRLSNYLTMYPLKEEQI